MNTPSMPVNFSGVVPALAQVADFGVFEPGFSAHRVRVPAAAACTATAQRTYT
jgi:hypothetical protein